MGNKDRFLKLSVAIAFAGATVDALGHNLLTSLPIMANRLLISQIPWIGRFLAENTGNLAYTAIGVSAVTGIAESKRIKGEEAYGNIVELTGLLGVASVNLFVESFKNGQFILMENHQFVPDLLTALVVGVAANYATKGVSHILSTQGIKIDPSLGIRG